MHPSPFSSWPLVALLALFPIAGLQAQTGGLFFSEYVEGSGQNKALEIYNGTGAPVDLSAYRIEVYFNGSPTPGTTLPLAGTLASGAVFVLAHEQAAAPIVDAADRTEGGGWFNGDDAVVLVKGSAVVDAIGQVGTDPGTGWGAGPVTTQDHTLRRKPTIVAGDTDPTDAFDPAVEWEGFAVNTADGLGGHGAAAGPRVVGVTPAAGAVGVATDAALEVRFDQAVDAACGWFALHCDTSGAHTATVAGGPQDFTLTPVPSLAPEERCTVTVFASQIAAQADGTPLATTIVWDFATAGGDVVTGDYYAPAQGLTGEALKTALHGIIQGHRERTYAEVWTILKEANEDPANPSNVLLLYAGRSQAKAANSGVDNSNPDFWNREHVWSRSHALGDTGTPGPATDAHNLWPADASINSARGNKDFDNGGTPHHEAPDTFTDADSWEPRDAVKGEVARTMFYMAVRYEGSSGEPDLELVDRTDTSGPVFGKRCTLVHWHLADPIDDRERHRNEVIFRWQDNRNPFIDHPEWVAAIWGEECSGLNP